MLWPWSPALARSWRTDLLWLLLWIGAPLLIGNLLLAVSSTVFDEDRYFLFVAPFVLWAVARGALVLTERWPPVRWLLAGGIVLLVAAALPGPGRRPSCARIGVEAAHYIVDYQQQSPSLPGGVEPCRLHQRSAQMVSAVGA